MPNKTTVGRVSALPARRFGKLVLKEIMKDALPGASTLFVHIPPRTKLPAIYHKNTREIVVCLKGRAIAVLDNRRHRISQGSYIFIPPNVRHAFITTAQSCDAIAIFSPPLWLDPKADVIEE